MERLRTITACLVFGTIVALGISAEAQVEPDEAAPQSSHVRNAEKRPMPFPPGDVRAGSAASLEFRSYEQMSEQDRDLAADGESAIGERAGFAGLEFNQGKWSYQQVICPALPHHLFLQFTRNNGKGDVSVFSASIPRGGDGRVRIIPIVRRGYSLFSPAPINALTISAFNHIRAEEHVDTAPEWLGTAMCYAALAGVHPQIGSPEESDFHKLPNAPTGREVIPMRGGAVLSFTDVAAMPRPMNWTMTFNGKGKLLKATHTAAPKMRELAVERTPTEAQGKPVPATSAEGKATLIQ
jgi:hypothetical protein